MRDLGCTCPASVYDPTTVRPTNPECVKHGKPGDSPLRVGESAQQQALTLGEHWIQ